MDNVLKNKKTLFLLSISILVIVFSIFMIETRRMTQITPTPITAASLTHPDPTWSPKLFSEDVFQQGTFEKTQLPEGAVKYSYPSSNPKRQNELIAKDGTVIYQRTVISDRYVYHYTNDFGAPDFSFEGSRFYGANTMVFVYLKKGVALVGDGETTLVQEQINFQPTNLEDFKSKYGEDIIDFTIVPTLPAE